MAEEKKKFPGYNPQALSRPKSFSTKEEIQAYYNGLLNHWYAYFNEIDDNLLDESARIIVSSIRDILLSFIQHGHIQLPETLIKKVETKTILLYSFYKNNQLDQLLSTLINIYTLFYSISNFYKKFDLEQKYKKIESLEKNIDDRIKYSNTQLNNIKNTLELANLTGLAAEFELQYKKYNKERIFWLMITLSLLVIIVSKIFEFIINPSNFLAFLMYLSLIISIVLYLNGTLIDDLIKEFKQPDDEQNSTKLNTLKPNPSKYTNRAQYISTSIGFIIFIGLYLSDNFSVLKLFSVELVTSPLNTWQDLIPHISIYIPMIWLLWFAIKQYHYTTKIMNAYRFKMALSLAYHGYKKECEELFKISKTSQLLQNSEQENKTLKDKEHEYKEYLLKEVLQVISDDPTKRDFKDTHMPWSEIKDVLRIFKSGK